MERAFLNFSRPMLVGHFYPSHARRSGYHMLARAMRDNSDSLLYPAVGSPGIVRRAIVGILNRVGETRWLMWCGLKGQVQASLLMARSRRPRVFHILYGEAGFGVAALVARATGHIVCATFHQTPSGLPEVIRRPQALNLLAGIIVVSRSQAAYFEAAGYRGLLRFIPHGVDCDYFSPPPERPARDYIRVISVGDWYRDFDTLNVVIQTCAQRKLNIFFDVIGRAIRIEAFNDSKNLRIYSGIKDEDLLKKYREADVFLQCYHDCTASNSLLEAMACGLPVITNDVGGVKDYVSKDCAFLVAKADVDGIVRALECLAENRELRLRMGDAARRHAENLKWERIAQIVSRTYNSLLPTPHGNPSRCD